MTQDIDALAKGGPWTCFHCGETFHDTRCARNHFGRSEDSEPGCIVKMGAEQSMLEAVRRAENAAAEAWAAMHAESTDAAKAYHGIRTRMDQAVRAAEELGFERGLAASRQPDAATARVAELTAEIERLKSLLGK